MTSIATNQAGLPVLRPELYIGGVWTGSSDGKTIEVLDPASGAVVAEVADATVEDGVAALDAAVAAAGEWAATPARRRGEMLRAAFDLLERRAGEFAALITREMGKPLSESLAEVDYGADFLRWFSEEAVRIGGDYRANPNGDGRIIVSHSPVGPCLLITPWNFPLAMATRKVAPALAAGCTVVIKPATLTPLTTLAFVALLEEVGLPAGVVNVITTTRTSDVCSRLIGDPRLRKLSFTGSTPVGVTLLAQAAPGVLRTSMELGGNAPFIVFDDADLGRAVDGAMTAKFRNTGQACTAANRFLVQSGIADAFAERMIARVSALQVGPGDRAGTTIGPLIDDRAVTSLNRLVADAVTQGAEIGFASEVSETEGYFFGPVVLDRVSPESAVAREEIFGPVLAITRFDTEDEAIRLANDTPYGLAGYAFTSDAARSERLISGLEVGMLGLNVGAISNAAAPFGGIKQSGLGREGGHEGIAEYLDTKYTLSQP